MSDDSLSSPSAKRRPGLRALAGLAPRLTDPLLRKRGFAEGRIVRDWAAIVGPELAMVCAPDKLGFPRGRRDGGTLTLRVVSGRALELQHLAPQLIERLNVHFGWAAVERIALRQGPLPKAAMGRVPGSRSLTVDEKAAVADWVSGIDDRRLKERLTALGEALAARRPPAEK